MGHTDFKHPSNPSNLPVTPKPRALPLGFKARSRLWSFAALMGLGIMIALFQGCGLFSDSVAGTSSGVDNPQISVAFTDSLGDSTRVTGVLSLYGQDQNPALSSAPIATFRLENSPGIKLSGLDILRSLPGSLAKATASIEFQVETVDTLVDFNVYLRTDGKQGALAMGLTYDGLKKKFTVKEDSSAKTVALTPRPLRRVQAVLDQINPGAGPDRIFIPGTPFLAVLVDSHFVMEEVPEGLFKLKLLTSEGKLFDINEPLDPRAPARFTCDKGSIRPLPDSTPPTLDFGVSIRAESTAFLPSGSFLEGRLRGVSETDPRISWLWRLIEGVDTNVAIWTPTESKTKVVYRAPGLYTFEVSATLGAVTHRDTQSVAVEGVSLAGTRFIAPGEGQMVMTARLFKVVWHSDSTRRVRLSLDTNSTGGTGPSRLIDSTLQSRAGYNEYNWFVPFDLPDFRLASLLLSDSTGAVITQSGRFLLRRPPPPPPPQ